MAGTLRQEHSLWGLPTHGGPQALPGATKVKTIFIVVLRHKSLFHYVNIYNTGAIVMAGKLLGDLAQIKAEAANSTGSYCILHLQALIIGKHVH